MRRVCVRVCVKEEATVRWLEAQENTQMEEPVLNEFGTQETKLGLCLCRLLCAC